MLAPLRKGPPPLRAHVKVGDTVDQRYKLHRDLGMGRAGRVFEAVHLFTGRTVALKLVAPDTPEAFRDEQNARLVREAHALASVRHPGVVEVLDGGFLPDRTPYLVTEMLEGRTLEGLIATRGHLSVEDTVAMALQLTSALDAAHAAGVVHRDVKPSNILLTRDHTRREALKLVDFGLARLEKQSEERLTGIGPLIGTPAYMAPEQLLGLEDIDNRCDVYALGVTMYECLTGRMPYEGSYPEVLLEVCSEGPASTLDPKSGVPEALALIIKKAMQKERPDRFPWMKDFREAILDAYPTARQHTEFFGPLPSARAKPAAAESRRKLARAPYVTPVRIVMGDMTIDGRTEDISSGGLLVVCHQVCPTEKRATMKFALPMEGRVIAVDVQVRWVKAARAYDPDGPRALGVEFIDPPQEMALSIARYVSLMAEPG
jgi:serine/threonine-protein kinase